MFNWIIMTEWMDLLLFFVLCIVDRCLINSINLIVIFESLHLYVGIQIDSELEARLKQRLSLNRKLFYVRLRQLRNLKIDFALNQIE